jgi:hypothetical protein
MFQRKVTKTKRKRLPRVTLPGKQPLHSLSLIITVTPQANPHPQASPSIPPPQFFPYFSFILFSEIPLNQFTQHTDIFLIQSWKNPIFHFYLFIHQVFYFLLESRISFFLLLFFLLYYTIESGFLKEGSF